VQSLSSMTKKDQALVQGLYGRDLDEAAAAAGDAVKEVEDAEEEEKNEGRGI